MNRRDILLGAVATSVAATLPAGAQTRGAVQIGFIGGGIAALSEPFLSGFQEGLATQGWRLGQSAQIIARYADGNPGRIPGLVAELEAERVAVIVTHAQATGGVIRAKRQTPVVYQFSADPVVSGFATDLAHPRYDATGITLLAAELNAKRLDFLREMAPELRRVAVVYNPLHPGEHLERGWLEGRGRELQFQLTYHPADSRTALPTVLPAVVAASPQAVLILADGFTVENRAAILDLSRQLAIPALSGWAVMAEAGAVLTFGPRLAESYRRAGYFVDRILRGARPETLPIEQPTMLELVINAQAAREIALAVPPSLLARADRIID